MKQITFDDSGLFRLYDKGIAVRSKKLCYHSHKPEESDELARWTVEAVGDPHVHSTQDIGVPDFEVRTTGSVKGWYDRGTRIWRVKDLDDTPPAHGWEATVHDEAIGFRQWLGKVLKVATTEGGWVVECERPFSVSVSSGTQAYFYRPGVLPSDNLFVPKLCTVGIWYDRKEGLAGPVPAPVEVYRRFWQRGKTSFYFADKVAEIPDGETIQLDVGYYAFVAQHGLQDLEVNIDEEKYVHHYNEPAAPFDVVLRDVAKPAYFLAKGLWVEQLPQDYERRRAPGKSIVVHNGRTLFNDKDEKVDGDGGIYFGREPGGSVWIARNVVGYDHGPRVFVKGCKLGRFAGGGFSEEYDYRSTDEYLGLDTYEFTSGLAVVKDELVGARRLTERVWQRTRLQIVWASPPESDDLPVGYDGGWAAAVMVPGDRTELIAEGDVIRLGRDTGEEPYATEYIVSESAAGVRRIGEDSPYALDDSWRDRIEVFTWFIILELDFDAGHDHEERVRLETLGKYISVARGWDVRHEIWRIGFAK